MREAPSRRPAPRRPPHRSNDPIIRGPVVVLPPTGPGGRERRFAIQPGKVFGLLILVFVLGASSAAAALWILTNPAGLRADYEDLRAEHGRLSGEVDVLRDELVRLGGAPLPPPTEQPPTGEPETAAAEPERPALNLPIASLQGAEPKVRVAVLATREEIVLTGEGIVLAHEKGEPTPMPRNQARIRPGVGGGIFIEGVGPVKQGTPIESRIGPIQIGERSYPGRVEVHSRGGEILLVNEVAMEDYVAGVVSSELPASWGVEAKRAQAVAARTYALVRVASAEGPYHLESTIMDQVYSGRATDPNSAAAVTTTHGEVVARDGKLVSVYFSSTCAGKTEDPHAVWPERPSHGTAIVQCGYCDDSPNHDWSATIPTDDVVAAIREGGGKATEIRNLKLRTSRTSGRVVAVDVETDAGTETWTGNEFRARFGFGKVRSTRFKVRFGDGGFELTGTGFGHGVGLCQYGAQGMGKAGFDYRQILGRYYPDSEVEKLW